MPGESLQTKIQNSSSQTNVSKRKTSIESSQVKYPNEHSQAKARKRKFPSEKSQVEIPKQIILSERSQTIDANQDRKI